MSILIDTQLLAKVSKTPSELIDVTASSAALKIRGCSIDLHIGPIYRPGLEAGKEGSATNPHRLPVSLAQGDTAVIETVESFKLDNSHAGFVFPSSRISIQGLLMTNPGHVDPGYSGSLHVTVINMGKEPFSLQPGTPFLRAFIHELDAPAVTPPPTSAPVIQELLNKLSPDFLNVKSRAEEAAKKHVDRAVLRTQWLQFVFPVIATIAAAGLGAAATYLSTSNRLEERTKTFEERIKSLETSTTSERIKALELSYPIQERLINIESKLKEDSIPKQVPPPQIKKAPRPNSGSDNTPAAGRL
ncbi:dCTP deaminase domain-containing protein [Pseudomonas sp. NPDC078416]|uniref:dCTP deaminase domain-containing protein n=1 Tax=Pseudomonas sp. NPDC078416 TaxID=3390637 RepID=UPI003CFC26A8